MTSVNFVNSLVARLHSPVRFTRLELSERALGCQIARVLRMCGIRGSSNSPTGRGLSNQAALLAECVCSRCRCCMSFLDRRSILMKSNSRHPSGCTLSTDPDGPHPHLLLQFSSNSLRQPSFTNFSLEKSLSKLTHRRVSYSVNHIQLWEKVPGQHLPSVRIAETRRHRSNFAAHFASASILFICPCAVRTLTRKLRHSDCAGSGDRSLSGDRPAKGDDDMSLRFFPAGHAVVSPKGERRSWDLVWRQVGLKVSCENILSRSTDMRLLTLFTHMLRWVTRWGLFSMRGVQLSFRACWVDCRIHAFAVSKQPGSLLCEWQLFK